MWDDGRSYYEGYAPFMIILGDGVMMRETVMDVKFTPIKAYMWDISWMAFVVVKVNIAVAMVQRMRVSGSTTLTKDRVSNHGQ